MKLLAERFVTELELAGRGRRVPLKAVWTAFQRANPHLAGSVHARSELCDLLKELAQSATVMLPRQKTSFDTVQNPPLPKWIQLPAPAATGRARERAALLGWHPALAFVSRLQRLGVEELDELIAIQAFFRDNSQPIVATVRERSFELFGDEKRLEEIAKGRLFGVGRLSFSLLSCTLIRTPCFYRDLGSGTAALIVENKDTFHSSCEAVQRLGSVSPVRWVMFGSGKAAITTIDSVNDWPTRPERAWYFGDIDAAGLAIGIQVGRVAQSWSLPFRITPASSLYRALVKRAASRRPRPSGVAISPVRAAELAAWLPEDIRPPVMELLVRGGSWPQEAVPSPILEAGLRELANENRWFDRASTL